MSFASPIPVWGLAAAVIAFAAAAALTYRFAWGSMRRGRAITLTALRTASLITLFLLLLRPVMLEPLPPGGTAVAVLVDASRSMGIDVEGGRQRRPPGRDRGHPAAQRPPRRHCRRS